MTKPQVTSAPTLDLPSDTERRLKAASRTPILLTEHLTNADFRRARHYHPSLYQIPEDAEMAREMTRL